MTDRIIIGKHPDTTAFGMWISKPGFSARTETDPDKFHFDPSKYLNRPFARLSVSSFTRGAFYTTLTSGSDHYDYYRWEFSFYHGLGYVPVFTSQVDTFVSAIYADSNYIKCHLRTQFLNDSETDGKRNASNVMVTPLDATNWYWDSGTNRMVFKKTNPPNISVYRVPLF